MADEALASWKDSDAKRAILEFVTESAKQGSPNFVPERERIAAFDNDGTLWVEKPAPVQAAFGLGKLAAQIQADPSLAQVDPYRALVTRDEAFLKAVAEQQPDAVRSLLGAVGTAWEGTTPEEYEAEVEAYFASTRHERFDRPFTDLVYRPMIELLDYLKANDWRVYVCSGGGRDFMRVICEQTWGLPRENVIGSAPAFTYRDGRLVREAALHGKIALGSGKPEDIYARTGRLPRFAAGNGDVDVEMLESADFALVVVHDDSEREYAYTDGAENVLAAAEERSWTTVSMKDHWQTIFEEGV